MTVSKRSNDICIEDQNLDVPNLYETSLLPQNLVLLLGGTVSLSGNPSVLAVDTPQDA
jgi:hypothetical protein